MPVQEVKDTKIVSLFEEPVVIDTVQGKNYGSNFFATAAYEQDGKTLFLTKKYSVVKVEYTTANEQNAPKKSDGTAYLPPLTCGPDGKLQNLDEVIGLATDKALEAINDPTKGIAANIGKIKSEISGALDEVNSKISDLAKPESEPAKNMQKEFEKLSAKLNDPEFGNELSGKISGAADKMSKFLGGALSGSMPAGDSLTNSINSAIGGMNIDSGAIQSGLNADMAKAQNFLSGEGDGSLSGELSKAFGGNLGSLGAGGDISGALSGATGNLTGGSIPSVSSTEILSKYNASKQKAIAEFEKSFGPALGKTGTSVQSLMGKLNDPNNKLDICKFCPNVDLVESGKDSTGAPIFKDIIKGTPLTVPETDAVKEKTQVDVIPKEAIKVIPQNKPDVGSPGSIIKKESTAEVLNNSTTANKIVVPQAPVVTTPKADKKEKIVFNKRVYQVRDELYGNLVSFTLTISKVTGSFIWYGSMVGIRGVADGGGITDEGFLKPDVGLPETAPKFWELYTKKWKEQQKAKIDPIQSEIDDLKASKISEVKKSPSLSKNARVAKLQGELALFKEDENRLFEGLQMKNQITKTKIYRQYRSSSSKLQVRQNQLSLNPVVVFKPVLLSESQFYQEAIEDDTDVMNALADLIETYERRIRFVRKLSGLKGEITNEDDVENEIKELKNQIRRIKEMTPNYPFGDQLQQ
tara:strand:+ start:3603 stop:5684 length:2082 start_codon:yes stop_codon:yes gene_type:complete